MTKFGEIKDSGQRQEFDTGAVRDTQDDKPRYDLIPPTALRRTAILCRNRMRQYELGKFYRDMLYHTQQFALGNTDHDYLAQITVNALHIMHFQDKEEPESTVMNKIFEICLTQDADPRQIRYDLIPPTALYRVAMHYSNGAIKYDSWNWALGMEFSRFYGSMDRHLKQSILGETDEDHLAAVVFNANAIMHFQDLIKHNPELAHLDDMKNRIPNTDCLKALCEMTPKYKG